MAATKTRFIFLAMLVIVTCSAQLLPQEEVDTLQKIASVLRNPYWNVTQRSCINGLGLNQSFINVNNQCRVHCDCSFHKNTKCHVTSIVLKRLNLTGTLPAEFANLPQLRQLDLSRNYINGSIPACFGQLRITQMSLLGNRIGGAIPKEIGNISTLQALVLEDNQLEGSLHPDLGNLVNLNKLMLSANNFSGQIPQTFGRLKNLTDFRIDGSPITGNIPEFIGNWTKSTRLDMQGTQMQGPFPSAISLLVNLKEIRVSDLVGGSINEFPKLDNAYGLKYLVLRNCSIIGRIPEYIGNMTSINTIDLSYNNLKGPIPSTFESFPINILILGTNSLSGDIPRYILDSSQFIDLSNNNFTGSSRSCQSSTVNLASSSSSSIDNSVSWCLKKDLPCPRSAQHHSIYINCGGGSVSFNGNVYEEDSLNSGPSNFFSMSERWAYTTAGEYMGKGRASNLAINSFQMNITGAPLYQTARQSPTSLKYFGLCLRKGSYTVRLHFAEIMFSSGHNFGSLGERIFDVAIQGIVVLRDFNIANEAKGVGIGITRDFNNVMVNGSTLEIHLYWTGKGTTAIPDRGVYGPLISAIEISANFDIGGGLSVGAIAGIVTAISVALLLVLVTLWQHGVFGRKESDNTEHRLLGLQTGHYTLREIMTATNNFSPKNELGKGGFGPVYKGILSNGTTIAVKKLAARSSQGNKEFVTEIGMISALQHPNVVKLFGCCIEKDQLLLIYEYLENNSLSRALFGDQDECMYLDWPTRLKICLGIAKGLAYLHEESRLKVVHRDIKTANVLLDRDLNAKISDFGLAKLKEEGDSHVTTGVVGTRGYMAPEYLSRGYLSDKADVFSFGIVTLEIVSGKRTGVTLFEDSHLLDWALVLQKEGKLLGLVDPSLGFNYSEEEAKMMVCVALQCTNQSHAMRPSMSSVVRMLQGKIAAQAPSVIEDAEFKGFDSESDVFTPFTSFLESPFIPPCQGTPIRRMTY